MKSRLFITLVFGICCTVAAAPTSANFILSVEPSSQDVGLGGTTSVDIVASLGTTDLLQRFYLTITYQTQPITETFMAIEASNATVGAGFTLDQPINFFTDTNYGGVDIFATAASPLRGDVTLATITFDAINVGTAFVGFGTRALYHPSGNVLDEEDRNAGSISVKPTANVPEPPTLVLLGLGLLAFVALRRAGFWKPRTKGVFC